MLKLEHAKKKEKNKFLMIFSRNLDNQGMKTFSRDNASQYSIIIKEGTSITNKHALKDVRYEHF